MTKNVSHSLTSEQALQRAASLCSASEHCIYDIQEKLRRWGLNKDEAEKIIASLIDGNYIDEARYARAYANDKLRFSHWGKIKIRAMLQMQHISDTDISMALDTLCQQEYTDILREVIRTKCSSLGIDDSITYEDKGKIIRFALQRGFEMNEILRLIDYPTQE